MASNPTHILLVDDDPDILAIAELALSDLGGLPTSRAANRAEALAALEANGADLVLMDLRLGEDDGRAAWEALRARAPAGTRVIFLTAAQGEETDGLTAEPGAIGLLRKPFDPMTLAETVRALWEAAR